jgi:hypothetical protein
MIGDHMEIRDPLKIKELHLERSPINNGVWDRLIPDMKLCILVELDAITFIRASEVSKEWQKLLQDNSLCKAICENSDNQFILYYGNLWEILSDASWTYLMNSNILLARYFRDIFDEIPENVVRFLDDCFSVLLAEINPDEYSDTDLTRLHQYLPPLPADGMLANSILKKLQELFIQMKAQVKNETVSAKLTKSIPINYYSKIKLLLQLRQMEQLLTTLVILRKMKPYCSDDHLLSIITNRFWIRSLTTKGLLLLTICKPKLNSGYDYIKIRELLRTNSTQVTEVKKKYFQYLQRWFNQAREEELLRAFDSFPETILTEPKFLAHISDRTMLILALRTFVYYVPSLFENREFIQRLKALPHAGNILIGLTQNKIEFNKEILQDSKNEEASQGQRFAEKIIHHFELTYCLTSKQLLSIVNLADVSSVRTAIIENNDFTSRIGCDFNLLQGVATKIFYSVPSFKPILLAKHPSIINKLSGDTCTSLILTNRQTALEVLQNDQLVLLLKPHHFKQLEKKYKTVQRIFFLILKREEEWLGREKAALAVKTELELYQLALSENDLSQLAAHFLAESDLTSKLDKIQLITLFNHCNRLKGSLLFAEPITKMLETQSPEEFCSLASSKEAIARFVAEYLTKNKKRLRMFSIAQLQTLIEGSHNLLLPPSFISVLEQTLAALPNRPRSYSLQDSRIKKEPLLYSPSLFVKWRTFPSKNVSPMDKNTGASLGRQDPKPRSNSITSMPIQIKPPPPPAPKKSKGSLGRILVIGALILFGAIGLLCLASGVGTFAGLGLLTTLLTAINVFKLSLDILAGILVFTGVVTTLFSLAMIKNCLKNEPKPPPPSGSISALKYEKTKFRGRTFQPSLVKDYRSPEQVSDTVSKNSYSYTF